MNGSTFASGLTPRRRAAFLISAAALATVLVAPSSGASESDGSAIPGCAGSPDHPGGDWRHYGGSLSNARTQQDETTITPANVADLTPAWSYSPNAEGMGIFYNTPIVYQGCLFLSTSSGYVMVRNADTGELVWRTDNALDGNAAGLIGGVTTGSPAVSDDFWIYVGVLRTHSPYVAAFKPIASGQWELAWTTIVDETPNSMIVTGPLLYEVPAEDPEEEPRHLLFQGFMGSEGTSTPRGGYAFLDPVTGEILAKDYTIDDESYDEGYRGASIWGTSAIDPETLYVYAPTGNPASNNKEHPNANAILKVDGDPNRETFGQIIDHYKGNPDNYVEQVDVYDNAVCQSALGEIGVIWGQVCLQMDLDFGAAPNLFTDSSGRTIVGALQKSGVYHAIDADTMERAWTTVVGAPGVPVNAAATAVDDERIFVNAQPPGQLWGLDRDSGLYDWMQPMADGISYLPVSTANGVVYVMDQFGNFRMSDAATGSVIAVRPMTQEFGTLTTAGSSPGIAIARNTVYVSIPDYLLAYRLP